MVVMHGIGELHPALTITPHADVYIVVWMYLLGKAVYGFGE
jgi:hypothetical protein